MHNQSFQQGHVLGVVLISYLLGCRTSHWAATRRLNCRPWSLQSNCSGILDPPVCWISLFFIYCGPSAGCRTAEAANSWCITLPIGCLWFQKCGASWHHLTGLLHGRSSFLNPVLVKLQKEMQKLSWILLALLLHVCLWKKLSLPCQSNVVKWWENGTTWSNFLLDHYELCLIFTRFLSK